LAAVAEGYSHANNPSHAASVAESAATEVDAIYDPVDAENLIPLVTVFDHQALERPVPGADSAS